MKLSDGRTLGYFEAGDPKGIPVVYIHGTPDSGIQVCGKYEHETAKRLGIRWIGPNRPGIGLSTFQPERKVLDYPGDLDQLISRLGLKSVFLLGTSGGTPSTLASAMKLPRERLRGVGICAGIGPVAECDMDGVGPLHRDGYKLWSEQPDQVKRDLNEHLVPLAQSGNLAAMKDAMRSLFGEILQGRDHDSLLTDQSLTQAARGWMQVYTQGAEGHAQDMGLLLKPWGFAADQVGYRGIKLWYGSDDKSTPPQMGRYMAARLPDAVYKEYPGESHFTIWLEGRLEEMLRNLVE